MRINGKAPNKHKRKQAAQTDAFVQTLREKTPVEIFAYVDSKIADIDLRKIIKALFLLTLEDK